MERTVLATAKAWVALIGAIVTALLGTVTPDQDVYEWLTYAAAICTAILTYVVPNRPSVEPVVRPPA